MLGKDILYHHLLGVILYPSDSPVYLSLEEMIDTQSLRFTPHILLVGAARHVHRHAFRMDGLEELPRERIDRVMVISAAGVGDSARQTSPMNRWLFRNSNIGVAYRDLEEMERILGSSRLDWMAVRPATLTNGQPTGRAQVIDYYGVRTRIRRAEVAEWMLARLPANEPFEQRTPMLAARGAHPP